MESVKDTQSIDMVIKLEDWSKDKEYDRLGLEDQYTEFLGNQVVCHTIPIRPGRNLLLSWSPRPSTTARRRWATMQPRSCTTGYRPIGKGPGKLVVSEECILNLEHMLKEVLVSEGAVCRFMEPMSSHTTFRIGGPAEAMYAPAMKKSWGRSSVCAGT